MLEQIRNAIQLASGVAEVPRQQAEKFAKDLAKRGELRASQVTGLTEQIVKRSQENVSMVHALVTSEIRRQVKAMGLATRDDLDRVNRKVFSLATKDDIDRLSKKLSDLEAKQKAPGAASTPRVAAKPKAKPRSASKKAR